MASTQQCAKQPVFLRVQFRNVDAAYYQFHLFPDYDFRSDEVCLVRLRNGDSQYIQLNDADPEEREQFERYLLRNYHVISVREITEEEFRSKQSEAV
jgi:hypothetical protein